MATAERLGHIQRRAELGPESPPGWEEFALEIPDIDNLKPKDLKLVQEFYQLQKNRKNALGVVEREKYEQEFKDFSEKVDSELKDNEERELLLAPFFRAITSTFR